MQTKNPPFIIRKMISIVMYDLNSYEINIHSITVCVFFIIHPPPPSILALHRLNVLTVISQSFLPFGSTPFLLQPYFNPADSLLFSILPGTTHFSPQKGDGGWSVALFRLSYIFPSDIIAAGNARVLERGGEGLHIDRKHEFPPSGTVRAECQSNDLHSIPAS